METKAHIRKRMLQLRDAMPETERAAKSRRIMQSVLESEEYQSAEDVLVYAAYRSEADTVCFIEQALKDGKKVYCPKVHGNEMEFYRIESLTELKEGYKGIREPEAVRDKCFTDENPCLMLMPGSAFDKERNRIGYGGGYYDKYLQKHPEIPTIAVCFECQIQKNIPADPHDWKPDAVVTECNRY